MRRLAEDWSVGQFVELKRLGKNRRAHLSSWQWQEYFRWGISFYTGREKKKKRANDKRNWINNTEKVEEQNYFKERKRKEKRQWNKIFHVDEKEELSESSEIIESIKKRRNGNKNNLKKNTKKLSFKDSVEKSYFSSRKESVASSINIHRVLLHMWPSTASPRSLVFGENGLLVDTSKWRSISDSLL